MTKLKYFTKQGQIIYKLFGDLQMTQAIHCWKPTCILKFQINSSLLLIANLISKGEVEKCIFTRKLQMKSPQLLVNSKTS